MLKHYHLRSDRKLCRPSLLWETRLDIQDVRSGYRDSDLLMFLGPLLDQTDADWTEDVVREINPSSLEEIDPPGKITWPAKADEKLIRHLLKYYRIPIWLNYKLGIYSGPRETREEFVSRCLSCLWEEKNLAFQKIRDIFLRRFLDIEHLLLEKIQEEDYGPELQERMISRVRDLFSGFREDFSRRFLEESLAPLNESDFDWTGKIDIELQERILKLRSDLVNRYNELNEAVKLKAESLERYEVTPSYQQIQIVSKGIIWPGDA